MRLFCLVGLHRWTPWFYSTNSRVEPEKDRRYCDRKGCKAYQRGPSKEDK